MINASKKKKEARKAPVPPVQPVVSKAAPQPSAAPFLIAEEKIPERAAEPTPTIAVEEEAETTESNLLTDREELRKAIDLGAMTAVVGSAITRPMLITKRFVAALEK